MKTKKGFVLLAVLLMGVFITTLAAALHITVRDELRIAANNRRIMQSKMAAESGMEHFKSLNLYYDNLRVLGRDAGQDSFVVIQETPLGPRSYYRVEVSFCCHLRDREFIVRSTGYFKDNGLIIAEHVNRSLFKTLN